MNTMEDIEFQLRVCESLLIDIHKIIPHVIDSPVSDSYRIRGLKRYMKQYLELCEVMGIEEEPKH